MFQEIAAFLGPRASCGIANSALPRAPVMAEPQRRPPLLGRLVPGALRRSAA